MSYIYVITNDINNHQYVGKTERTIELRFKEHCKDRYRTAFEKRPLYEAMNKYGIEHFHIQELEQCDYTIVDEREKYWIEKLNTFHNGYNATIGGDGKRLLDYELVVATYNQLLNVNETSKILGIDKKTISKILITTGAYTQEQIWENAKKQIPKNKVAQYDKQGNLIAIYDSVALAEKAVSTGKHIGQVCTGKRKTAGGYIWKYINNEPI